MFYGFYGPYPLLLLASLLFSMYASAKVKRAYSKYSRIGNKTGMTGAQAARRILDANGLTDVRIELTPGVMSDHYDPSKRVMRLSEGVYNASTLAAISIAAHESGHAIQHGEKYGLLSLRNTIAIPVGWASKLAWVFIIIGILLTGTSMYMEGNWLLDIGIIMFAAVVVFHLVTLPVELDASKRALVQMREHGIMFKDETEGARKMLKAAAMTYLAALAAALVQLIRLLAIRGRN